MITHSVYFNLRHPEGSGEEKAFLGKAMELRSISTVGNFLLVREISPKNNYSYGLVMEFEDDSGYAHYNEHPGHMDFVKNCWLSEVKDFIEIDYVTLATENSP